MSSIFSKIIQGEIPSYKVAEDDRHLAFLDIRPLAVGHTLVIPKKEVDYIFDLSDDDFKDLHIFSKRVARAIEKCIDCKRVGSLVIGTEVPHAHIHLIPFQRESQMSIESSRVTMNPHEMAETALKIKEAFI